MDFDVLTWPRFSGQLKSVVEYTQRSCPLNRGQVKLRGDIEIPPTPSCVLVCSPYPHVGLRMFIRTRFFAALRMTDTVVTLLLYSAPSLRQCLVWEMSKNELSEKINANLQYGVLVSPHRSEFPKT